MKNTLNQLKKSPDGVALLKINQGIARKGDLSRKVSRKGRKEKIAKAAESIETDLRP